METLDKHKKNGLCLLFSISLFLLMGFRPQQESNFKTRLDLDRNGNILTIKGVFINNSEEELILNYKMNCLKQGKSGKSTSAQSGKFTSLPGENKVLSTTSISVSPKDQYEIILAIRDHAGKLIASDTVSQSSN